MRAETLNFICLCAFSFSFFVNAWRFCAVKGMKPATALKNFIIGFIFLAAVSYTIASLCNVNIYAGYCDKCGQHYTFLLDRWSDKIRALNCRYCGNFLWYIQN